MTGNKNLQFTNASQLNDPFDCHPKLIDYSNILDSENQKGIPKEWRVEIEENNALNLRNDTWLCSLSKVKDSILMWSHYCYNHKGVCIGIDIDKVMECVPPMFGSIYLKPLIIEVQYQDIIKRPKANDNNNFAYQWMAKAKDWEYEQEVRLVMPSPNPMYAAFTFGQAQIREKQPDKVWDWREIHHYLPLKNECFDSIYFGINIEQDEKEKIIQYARKELNPQIKLYQMEVDENAFKLRPVSI